MTPIQDKLFIDGEFVDSDERARIPVLNPHDNSLITEVAEAKKADVDRAVEAARRAFPAWAKLGAADRGLLLLRLADAIEANADELAKLESIDTGHPLRDTRGLDVVRTAVTFRYFGGMADKFQGSVVPVEQGFLNYVLREPVGVVGQIVPWNFPLMFTSWKMGPALAAGNTVVMKPAELTPLSTLKIAELATQGRISEGRDQHPARLRQHCRPVPRRAPRRRQDRIHRLDCSRTQDRAGLQRQSQARAARTRRQGRQHRVRRCLTAGGDQRLRLRHFPQSGAGVHRRFAADPA